MKNVYGEKSNIEVQWEKVKDGPFKGKLDWFVRYFGLYVLVGIIAIGLLTAWIITATRSNKPELLSGMLLDVDLKEGQESYLKEVFCEKFGLESPDSYKLGLDGVPYESMDFTDQYYQQQTIMARVSAGELDIVGAKTSLAAYALADEPESGLIAPLTEYLSDAEIRALDEKGLIVYLETEAGVKIPFFIDIANSPFAELLWIKVSHYEIGFSWTAPHPERFSALVRFILGD
ncbi:MAG: hypothetical protein IKY02_04025 [Lachnospiraceae bacterium]|nr:hypothetical protein [Lachnospiraceae bacterium]MBR5739136.1 hypothetical protein [Lachnospiraceae bacterium]